MSTVELRRRQFRAEEAIAKPTEEGMVITLPGLAIGCTPVEFHEFVERVWSTYFSGLGHQSVLDGMPPRRHQMKRHPILAACVLPWIIPAAALFSSGYAHADPVLNYTRVEAGVICNSLTENPSLTTVSTLFRVIAKDAGFTVEEAAKVITGAVGTYCPENSYVLQRFVDVFSAPPPTHVVSGRLGGRIGG